MIKKIKEKQRKGLNCLKTVIIAKLFEPLVSRIFFNYLKNKIKL
jgi:hypothetical protein